MKLEVNGSKWQITYSDTEAGDALSLTLGNDSISHMFVVRLPISDDHHHLGGVWSTAVTLSETILTEKSRLFCKLTDQHQNYKYVIIKQINRQDRATYKLYVKPESINHHT